MAAALFWSLVLVCCGYGAAYGGRDGRRLAVIYVLACLLTVVASRLDHDWARTQPWVMAVDLLLMVALVWLALRSSRWFPIWFAGFHLVAVASHLASAVAPGFATKIYFLLQALWSIPMLLVFAIGVTIDRQAGVVDDAAAGVDPVGDGPAT